MSGTGRDKQVHSNPADASGKGVVWAAMLWGTPSRSWSSGVTAMAAATEGSQAWQGVKGTALAGPLIFHKFREKTRLDPKPSSLMSLPGVDTSLHPALQGLPSQTRNVPWSNLSFSFHQHWAHGTNGTQSLRKPNSIPYTDPAESSLGKNEQTAKLSNRRTDDTFERRGHCCLVGRRD